MCSHVVMREREHVIEEVCDVTFGGQWKDDTAYSSVQIITYVLFLFTFITSKLNLLLSHTTHLSPPPNLYSSIPTPQSLLYFSTLFSHIIKSFMLPLYLWSRLISTIWPLLCVGRLRLIILSPFSTSFQVLCS